jgi:dipeptidyl aminopeptidase/acylaminoacyl peptidase
VDVGGAWAREIADADSGYALIYGYYADLSPAGTQVVYSTCAFPTEGIKETGEIPERSKYTYEIAVTNLAGTRQKRLTENAYSDHFPVWSPDGSRIAFIANPRSLGWEWRNLEVYTMAADGSDVRLAASTLRKELEFSWHTKAYATRRKVRQGEEIEDSEDAWLGAVALAPPAWSPDGRWLAFQVNDDRYDAKYHPIYLYTVDLDEQKLQRVAEDVNSVVSWSPDGQRLAFMKATGDGDDGGNVALVTLAADGSDEKLIATIASYGIREGYVRWIPTVSWSSDGTQILYSCNSAACVVNVEDGEVIELTGERTRWNQSPYLAAWSPDGTRIALFKPAYRDIPPQLYTVALDGTDRRDLIRLDADGKLVPANTPQQSE